VGGEERPVPNHAGRFAAKVDRAGEHDLWLGAKDGRGAGVLKVDGRIVTARRVAWELEHGELPTGARVLSCPDDPACVRVDHLALQGTDNGGRGKSRRPRGGGSKTWIRPGVCKLTVTVGRWDDGTRRRLTETVYVDTELEADRELARFVSEVEDAPLPDAKADRDVTVDEAIERYLTEHLVSEKGRESGTLRAYRSAHRKWFSPEIGRWHVRDVDEATIDRIFGRMRKAGLSASRMRDARNLYQPFFRWAKRRRLIRRNPMADFELPTSNHVAREHVPPEVEQLCLYLEQAVELVPDVAPVLALGAVTGMRRGELVAIRRSGVFPEDGKLRVEVAYSEGGGVKTTKTRREREVFLDQETVSMLVRHCAQMDERAAAFGVEVAADGYAFSLEPDCSAPMPAEYVTKQVATLKESLGIANKRPETIELEDEALRLRRQPVERARGTSGPQRSAVLSYTEIGKRLGRSNKWAMMAVRSAERREALAAQGSRVEMFDGSILALRKFTSNELLDAGFNISMVAQRQGHGPQVLVKHYAKSRRSADRKAAEHLGHVVHRRAGDLSSEPS
jgi:integrase